MAKKKPASKSVSVPVEAHTHPADTRSNIPTRELAALAPDDGIGKAIYHRARELDPQLVWTGKDEQDAKGALEVPAVPVYVQEKIHPRAIVDDLKARVAASKPADNLFSDFNGLDDFQKKLEFYQHEQHWTNRLILGDSLLVMTSLAEKERLRGKVQCVYFDPPYGIKFGSNWQVSTRENKVKDAKSEDLTRQPEQIKAFRDTWELGIHSYLTYIRDRLAAARDLLTESGSVFVQIGDENVHRVRALMDEVFGDANFVTMITVKKTAGLGTDSIPAVTDFVLWYAKDQEHVKVRTLYTEKELEGDAAYSMVELKNGNRRRLTADERENHKLLEDGARVFRYQILLAAGRTESCIYPIRFNDKDYNPTAGRSWATNAAGTERLIHAGRVAASGTTLSYVRYAADFPVNPISNFWADTASGSGMDKVYVVQTSTKVIERCLLLTTDPGDLVFDPTYGSGTTAYVAEQWGRRWITTDTSRVAIALARTRLMAARFPYYYLADSVEGRKKQSAMTGVPLDPQAPATRRDLHKGFVYKTVPHVTLKSIANNPDIKEGMSREAIDKAISKHTERETLYDLPYEDKSVVRLTGPFTVESLSPHKALPTSKAQEVKSPRTAENYLSTVLDNLRKAGVKGTDKAQRIGFTRLDPYADDYIQAEGETTDNVLVRVSVGPQTGTVGDAWIASAALQAVQGSKCDLLLVCAFAFEGSVHEKTAALTKETKLGKLRVLPVRMNPDLAMFGEENGKELLKKTGAANLFTVFGEPDLKIDRDKDGKVVVTIRGVDVFDPSTSEVRTGGTDDIACWFIDTDYNGESFFVRHAYFLYGGKATTDGPYDKLKKALRAEVDEAEWSKLYSATSQPFDVPARGKIAVKVINHFGDEVLKVYPVPQKASTPAKEK